MVLRLVCLGFLGVITSEVVCYIFDSDQENGKYANVVLAFVTNIESFSFDQVCVKVEQGCYIV
ncbi:hypothetical protein YBT1518_32657 (plasmid) [Bacillus thuringiensis YBT-1518]|uniref:Uncharacterized protein n=1 Tax=Bacillus thuringiensis YBT-1518 TaxID=529122 RepID=A0A9W3KJ55_BACTU|nr:hypothetical protein YBT1518_32657 [Bacillus thuringiensis YBT-1518]